MAPVKTPMKTPRPDASTNRKVLRILEKAKRSPDNANCNAHVLCGCCVVWYMIISNTSLSCYRSKADRNRDVVKGWFNPTATQESKLELRDFILRSKGNLARLPRLTVATLSRSPSLLASPRAAPHFFPAPSLPRPPPYLSFGRALTFRSPSH